MIETAMSLLALEVSSFTCCRRCLPHSIPLLRGSEKTAKHFSNRLAATGAFEEGAAQKRKGTSRSCEKPTYMRVAMFGSIVWLGEVLP